MKERILMKGLMALTVAFILMFGSSLTVLAATTYSMSSLQVGQILQGGDKIQGSGSIDLNGIPLSADQGSITDYTLPPVGDGGFYEIMGVEGNDANGYRLEIAEAYPADEQAPEAAPSGDSGHLHTMEWIIGREPTETQDGLYQYKCTGCDHVEAQQPITYFGVIIKKIIKAIEEAPENGTVIIDNEFLRCITDEIVAALLARPDVTVDVRFTEGEVAYRFLVPAGQAPTDGQEWYGYFYLGGVLYGWQAPVTEEEA